MKFKVPYSIKKSLTRILPFVATAIMANACQKEHDVIIDWNWKTNIGYAPSKKIIQKELNKKNVNTVFLNFGEQNLTNWLPVDFHRAHDTLQTYMDMAPGHIRFIGTFYVSSRYGAHLPDVNIDTIAGMGLLDSIWWTANGVKVMRWAPGLAK